MVELSIKVPTDYNGISLKTYLELQKEMKNYEGEEEAQTALMLYHLCGIPAEYINGISVEDYNLIKNELEAFIGKTDLPLQKIIQIDGVEYGFEPNLSQISYGAYSDITKFQTLTIDENWAKVMSILYRPVTNKKKDMYSIQPYTGDIDDKLFLNVGMDVHLGALFFFVRLSMDLQNATLNSLKEMVKHPNIKSILEESGQLMLQSSSLHKETSLNMKQLLKSR